jgi:hypothetical protein
MNIYSKPIGRSKFKYQRKLSWWRGESWVDKSCCSPLLSSQQVSSTDKKWKIEVSVIRLDTEREFKCDISSWRKNTLCTIIQKSYDIQKRKMNTWLDTWTLAHTFFLIITKRFSFYRELNPNIGLRRNWNIQVRITKEMLLTWRTMIGPLTCSLSL